MRVRPPTTVVSPLASLLVLLLSLLAATAAQAQREPSLAHSAISNEGPGCVSAFYTVDELNWFSVSEGDTVPDGAYVLFEQTAAPGLRHQTRVDRAFGFNDQGAERFFRTQWSPAEIPDTLGFHVGPFEYQMKFRTVDAMDEPSEAEAELSFVVGFEPRLTSVSPENGEVLVVRMPFIGLEWPENEIPHTVNPDDLAQGEKRWWDGSKYIFDEFQRDPTWFEVQGKIIRYRLRFEGEADPREPDNGLRSWSYAVFGENDPRNTVKEGAGLDVLGRFDSPGTLNSWEMSEEDDGVEIFVPSLIWLQPSIFEPGMPLYSMGQLLAKQLGEIQLQVQARTTQPGDEHSYCNWEVRESCGDGALLMDIEELGRRTEVAVKTFTAHLGLDPSNSGSITEYWPPPGYVVPVLVSGLRARMVDDQVQLDWEWGADARGASFRLDRIAADGRVERIAVPEALAGGGPARIRDLPDRELEGQLLRYVLIQESAEGDEEIAEIELRFEIPRAGEMKLHANVPNPFNPNTMLNFELAKAGHVRLSIHDAQGRKVRSLVGEVMGAGRHERNWDGRADNGEPVASGVYFARLESLDKVASIRMLLVK